MRLRKRKKTKKEVMRNISIILFIFGCMLLLMSLIGMILILHI
jgi:hypothetical protein